MNNLTTLLKDYFGERFIQVQEDEDVWVTYKDNGKVYTSLLYFGECRSYDYDNDPNLEYINLYYDEEYEISQHVWLESPMIRIN